MPYKKKYKYNKKKKYNSKADTALKLIRKMQKAKESKFHIKDALIQGVNSSGTIVALNEIPQGTTDEERIGDKVHNDSLFINYYVTNTSTTVARMFRLMIIYDKFNTISATSLVLQTVSSSRTVISTRNWDYRQDYVVLYDNAVYLAPSPAIKSIQHIKKYIKLNKDTQYVAASTTAISKGSLKMLVFSNEAAAAFDVDIEYYHRLVYSDC